MDRKTKKKPRGRLQVKKKKTAATSNVLGQSLTGRTAEGGKGLKRSRTARSHGPSSSATKPSSSSSSSSNVSLVQELMADFSRGSDAKKAKRKKQIKEETREDILRRREATSANAGGFAPPTFTIRSQDEEACEGDVRLEQSGLAGELLYSLNEAHLDREAEKREEKIRKFQSRFGRETPRSGNAFQALQVSEEDESDEDEEAQQAQQGEGRYGEKRKATDSALFFAPRTFNPMQKGQVVFESFQPAATSSNEAVENDESAGSAEKTQGFSKPMFTFNTASPSILHQPDASSSEFAKPTFSFS